jgi:lipoprotein-releasing system permease protein
VGLGMLVLKYRNDILDIFKKRDMELFPEELYGFPELPAQIIMGDLVVISVVSLALCVVAGLLPAWNAARLQPVEALRND